MYKLKNKVGFSVILVVLMILIIPNVKAETKQNTTNTCDSILFDGKMLTADEANGNIRVYAKAGKWRLKYYINEDEATADYSMVIGNQPSPIIEEYVGGETRVIRVGAGNTIFLVAELLDDDSIKCKAGNVSISKEKNNETNEIKISGTAAYIAQSFPKSSLVNKSVSGDASNSCQAMIEAKLNVGDKTSYLKTPEDINKYNAQMRQSFPYCYQSYSSSFEVTASTIDAVRKESLKAYKAYLDFLNKQNDNIKYDAAIDEIQKEGYKLLEYSKKGVEVGTLSCNKKQTTENTEKYYTTKQEVNNSACRVQCVEQLQVTYDPPEATKAGLCFQYKVTVKSKVSCKAELTNEIKWPTPVSVCDYTPICSGNANETQAGPNDNFDSCINSCDGGNYSQSCINKCYKKVYGKTAKSTKTANTTSESNVVKTTVTKTTNNSSVVRLASDPYNIAGCSSAEMKASAKNFNNGVDDGVIGNCAQKFYNVKQLYPMGQYVALTSHPSWYTHKWKTEVGAWNRSKWPKDDDWVEFIKRAAPYYFRDVETAKKTILSFYPLNINGHNGYGQKRQYAIDDDGIKRQYTSKYSCGEVCGFRKTGGSNNCVSSSTDLQTYYTKAFQGIYNELSACTTKAECKDGQASFNMNVDYDKTTASGKDNSGNTEWDANNRTNSDEKTCYNPSGDIKMFIPLNSDKETGTKDSICNINPNGINGKCYGKNNASYWQHYKTTITFPGTWVDLKTSKRYYKEPSTVEKNYLKEKENYYCTGYDYKPVNKTWWDWKINGVGNIDNITVEKPDNIKAKITNFGKYNWSVNVNCFYALNNQVTNCVGENCNPSCKDGECDTTLNNVKIRAVDQQNMFAGRTGDSVGFNWTSAAQDKVALNASNASAKTYGIDPGAYAKELENAAKGNSNAAYSGDADYSLHLTKENIKALRNYVKSNGYTSYQGNGVKPYKEVSGIDLYYYTSGILGKNTYTTSFQRNTKLGVNND